MGCARGFSRANAPPPAAAAAAAVAARAADCCCVASPCCATGSAAAAAAVGAVTSTNVDWGPSVPPVPTACVPTPSPIAWS
eukprot:11180085-Lingulodinium_polyedra.AAC.1